MLLLYQDLCPRSSARTEDLHSTMLLLYHNNYLYLTICTLFTFHYASTLSGSVSRIIGIFCPIYIPLCFYFIYRRNPEISRRLIFTFHYASTLSWPYIEQDGTASGFTFHYASTLSFSDEIPACGLLWFTFHYASTLSKWRMVFKWH